MTDIVEMVYLSGRSTTRTGKPLWERSMRLLAVIPSICLFATTAVAEPPSAQSAAKFVTGQVERSFQLWDYAKHQASSGRYVTVVKVGGPDRRLIVETPVRYSEGMIVRVEEEAILNKRELVQPSCGKLLVAGKVEKLVAGQVEQSSCASSGSGGCVDAVESSNQYTTIVNVEGTFRMVAVRTPVPYPQGMVVSVCEEAKPESGNLTLPSGQRYRGDFVDGKPHGNGVLTWPNGQSYRGDFVDGKPQGKGVLTWPNGQRYEGDFVNGEFHGKGRLTLATGERHEGNFANGKFVTERNRIGGGELLDALFDR